MRNRLATVATGVATLFALAACGQRAPELSADLQRDLDLSGGSGMELAPVGGRTQVVSATELGRTGVAAPKATRAPRARIEQPRPQPAPMVAAAQETPEPEVAPIAAPSATPEPEVDAAVPATAPRPHAPQPTPARRRGGYSSVADVIRNAPFPINP